MDFSACLSNPSLGSRHERHSHFLWMDLNTTALITAREDGRESKTCARRHYKFKCTFSHWQRFSKKKTTGKTFSFYTRRRWNWFSFSTFLLFRLLSVVRAISDKIVCSRRSFTVAMRFQREKFLDWLPIKISPGLIFEASSGASIKYRNNWRKWMKMARAEINFWHLTQIIENQLHRKLNLCYCKQIDWKYFYQGFSQRSIASPVACGFGF